MTPGMSLEEMQLHSLVQALGIAAGHGGYDLQHQQISDASPLGRSSGTQLAKHRQDFTPMPAALCSGLAVIFWFLKAWYAE